ncbi:arylesterase [Aquimixticola soesokkakensis]|uniref:arylesterase n=1 Tax=Aquimixticola soesokkakensis TaxID=1519096 RepID=UPI001F22F0F3|nr:arylesterase [Aquimixticola soesokkakensis]
MVTTAGLLGAGPALGDPLQVLALGDSLTAGYGLARDSGFVPQLQAALDARGTDVVIVNAGVSGDTTAGGRARLDWSLTPDIDAVIVELGGNDLLRALDPAQSKANLDAIVATAQARDLPVLIAGLQAPANYGAAYKAAFDGMFRDLSVQYDTLLYPDFFAGLRSTADRASVFQADGIHPNQTGVALIVADILPQVEALIARAQP